MKTKEGAPPDRGCMVAIIFFIHGLGTLLPWNFFMTASANSLGTMKDQVIDLKPAALKRRHSKDEPIEFKIQSKWSEINLNTRPDYKDENG